MKIVLLLPLLTCLAARVWGKIFGRCELAKVLHQAGLDGYHGYQLADWLCMAFYESRFDTGAREHEADGSTSNGIFQINSHLWCEDYRHPSPNLCQMHCSDLLTSNIDDDIICAMKIAKGPRGLGACSAADTCKASTALAFGTDNEMSWRENCEGLEQSTWLKECDL